MRRRPKGLTIGKKTLAGLVYRRSGPGGVDISSWRRRCHCLIQAVNAGASALLSPDPSLLRRSTSSSLSTQTSACPILPRHSSKIKILLHRQPEVHLSANTPTAVLISSTCFCHFHLSSSILSINRASVFPSIPSRISLS